MRGEDWNVAEAYGIKYDEETGEEISGYWVTDEKMTRFIDGSEVLTVKDKINGSDTINLMSSVTAKKGIERVEEQLTRVKDMREKFSSFIMSYNGEDLDGLPQTEWALCSRGLMRCSGILPGNLRRVRFMRELMTQD